MDMIAHAHSLFNGIAQVSTVDRKLTRREPLVPSPMDWAADWLQRHLPGLTVMECHRIVAWVLMRHREGQLLTDWESRVFEAFDRAAQED